jgi:hypothetical protein
LILDDFNKLADNLKKWYGEDQVEVIKVDGGIAKDISYKYGVERYPKFMAILPNSDGNSVTTFSAPTRNYSSLKKWAL